MSAPIADQLIALLPRLRRFALALAKNRDTADDLVQIACEKALAAASFQPGTRFDAWMFTILRNAWYDRLRKQRGEGISEEIGDALQLVSPNSGEAEDRLQLKAVLRAVGQLPTEQREVLVLTCIEEFSYQETAAMLGIPIGTVMSRLARARAKIAKGAGIVPAAKR